MTDFLGCYNFWSIGKLPVQLYIGKLIVQLIIDKIYRYWYFTDGYIFVGNYLLVNLKILKFWIFCSLLISFKGWMIILWAIFLIIEELGREILSFPFSIRLLWKFWVGDTLWLVPKVLHFLFMFYMLIMYLYYAKQIKALLIIWWNSFLHSYVMVESC